MEWQNSAHRTCQGRLAPKMNIRPNKALRGKKTHLAAKYAVLAVKWILGPGRSGPKKEFVREDSISVTAQQMGHLVANEMKYC